MKKKETSIPLSGSSQAYIESKTSPFLTPEDLPPDAMDSLDNVIHLLKLRNNYYYSSPSVPFINPPRPRDEEEEE